MREPSLKVVINSCYGGFGLSDIAIEKCIALGMTCTDITKEGKYVNPEADFFINRQDEKFLGKYYAMHSYDKNFRINPILVKVVEELGKESNGSSAELSIVEIPFESTEGWHIDEYDGIETIEESHRSWS